MSYIDGQDNITVVEENEKLRQHIDTHYKPAVDEAYGEVISTAPSEIKHERRPGDNGFDKHGSDVAPIVAAGQYYWAATTEVSNIAGITADLSLVGAGGVRTNIAAGDLREGNISLELLPFSNFMSIVPLKGAVIKDLISSTVTATLPAGSHAGKFPYGGNLRYTFTEDNAGIDGTLTAIEINKGSLDSPSWEPLQDNTVYNVAMNNYNATGNDGWTPLYEAQKTNSDRIDLAYVDGQLTAFAVDYIEENNGKYKVIYENESIDCDNPSFSCNTDAQAVIEYIKVNHPTLAPNSYETVTLERVE